ncbi:pyridoxamine 5'-phosphate oxidase family protein [Arthrobacter wenxiniae]|uniref:Pyridoxamine 5'-phosphate oxidase family protein n=1 Tax=Arthrobacter wenxiniae TaxID=2713570 RepID=A0A7Y7IFD9_9MICC|nr:pyridoxamine 5'-phosphate oxidase family protein [Arthrobacter wenxiniae]NVM94197.1 pyridoxamine 5'-phosphate oxidase family protein [Arthrobacter wenxiniae]
MNTDEEPGVVLSREEAWELLQGSRFGRLAVSVANQPDVYPLNYLATQEKIWIRTNPGSKLAELTVNSLVAFEADGLSDGTAWSVVVKGVARILESQTEIDAADLLPVEPWIKTRMWTHVEVTPASVSGRRFVLGAEPERC